MVETSGRLPLAGKTRKSPAPLTFSAPKLNDTAAALAGIEDCPMIVKLRVALATSEGGPEVPVKPLPPVAATPHGEKPMNGSGLVTTFIGWTPKDLGRG